MTERIQAGSAGSLSEARVRLKGMPTSKQKLVSQKSRDDLRERLEEGARIAEMLRPTSDLVIG